MKKLFAVAAASLLILAGCGSNDNASDAGNAGKKLTVLTNSGYAPYEVRNTDGELEGFDIELTEMIAKELGYSKIITYILETESGDSLAASGWLLEDAKCGGGNWSCKSRPRNTTAPQCFKQRWSKMLN